MLTRSENQLLCQVGPGTPMGALLRQYWLPAVRGQALVADGAPLRVKLLGEDFVAFRSSDGRVGFFDEACPHRCTSLALARNEDNALRCIFHGWKIDVSGKVVEVPSEPPERRAEFAAKVRVRHYPVREAGGVIWVYIGVREPAPQFPAFETNTLPPEHLMPMRAVMHCNWLQGYEAVLDAAHVGILHQSWLRPRADANRSPNMGKLAALAIRTAPVFEIMPKPYGFREGALRDLGDGTIYARIREVVLPFWAFIPNDPPLQSLLIGAVPIDDEWTAQWYFWYDPDKPMTEAERTWQLSRCSGDPNNFCSDMGGGENLWNQNRQAMKEGHFTGIRSFLYEDFVVEESMGPIADRSREYLGSSDAIIVRVRRMLLAALRDWQRGVPAPGTDQHIDYGAIRALGVRYGKDQDWRQFDSRNQPRLEA